VVKFLSFLISDHQRESAATPCFSISAIMAIMAILAIFALPPPLPPYVHPFPPKVTQSTQGQAEGRNPKMQRPSLKPGAKTTSGPQAPSPATSRACDARVAQPPFGCGVTNKIRIYFSIIFRRCNNKIGNPSHCAGCSNTFGLTMMKGQVQ
jgi:hypothetical protein